MAKKDIAEKILLSYADVFADCENALVYEGRQVVKAEELHPAPTESFYRDSGGIHSQFCDVGSVLVKNGAVRARYIIENETRLSRRQILRKASYEGGAYREQLKSGRPVYPVYSMVLDWTRKSSRIPLSLHRLLLEDGAEPESLRLVDDIRLTVCHMNSLPPETRSRFTSDMGFVVDYLSEKSFENRRNQKILHVDALCRMMEALTGDTRFTALARTLLKKQQEGKDIIMCEYIDMLEAKGEQRGITKGIRKGFRKGIRKGVQKGVQKGISRGIKKGEDRAITLLSKLYSLGRYEDARLAVADEAARKRFYEEFQID